MFRLAVVNRSKGALEILTPEEYLQRGIVVLRANADAIKASPRKDVQYPDWSIRYVNRSGGLHGIEHIGTLCSGGIAEMLADPIFEFDDTARNWLSFRFFSKGLVNEKNKRRYVHLGTGNVATTIACAQVRTLVQLNICAQADIDIPGEDTQRLYSSELMYQAWRDTCAAKTSREAGAATQITSLRYIIHASIVNQGTYQTIEDVLSKEQIRANDRVTFTSSDENTDAFKMLMGTANARPVARMCADHAESLGGKQVVKIHTWYDMPQNGGFSAIIFELA